MHKSTIVAAIFLLLFIFFAVLLTLQIRKPKAKKRKSGSRCSEEPMTITSFTVDSHDVKGQIGPSFTYEAATNFNLQTSTPFKDGGFLFSIDYPNEEENDIMRGTALVDATNSASNSAAHVPCAVAWDGSSAPVSTNCTTTQDVKGWNVKAIPIKTWFEAQNVNSTTSNAIMSNDKVVTVTFDPIDNCEIYVATVTLVGKSYGTDNTPVTTTFSFGTVSLGNTAAVTIPGSYIFTASAQSTQTVRVVGFKYCDVGEATSTCVGLFLD